MALIPDDLLDPENDRVLKIHNSEYEPWVKTKDGRFGWSDLARELKACREALREIDRAACVETSDPATGAISSLARARLPEHKEESDA